jgi:hypothetical protein
MNPEKLEKSARGVLFQRSRRSLIRKAESQPLE